MRTHPPTRRTRLAILVAASLLLACSGSADKAEAPTVTAAELLQRAVTNLVGTQALSFTLTAQPVVPGLRFAAVAGGQGTVVWPDRLVFQGTMQSTPTLTAPVVIVMCGPDRYIELGDGNFMKVEALPDVQRLLFAPDSGLATGMLTKLDQVSTPEAATLGKDRTWRLSGTVSPQLLAALPGRTAPAPDPLRAELWIGQQDSRLRQVTLRGPMFDGDSAKTVRTLVFSHLEERTPLTVPRGQFPCGTQA